MGSYAENVSIWWRHHDSRLCHKYKFFHHGINQRSHHAYHKIFDKVIMPCLVITWSQIVYYWHFLPARALINTLRPRRNEQHFADDIFKHIFFNENVSISIKISLKFVPKGLMDNIPALVQIMAWLHSGDKPLSELKMVSLITHICVTWPQWVIILPQSLQWYTHYHVILYLAIIALHCIWG